MLCCFLDTNKKGNFGSGVGVQIVLFPKYTRFKDIPSNNFVIDCCYETPETMFVDLYKIGSKTAFLTRI